MKYRRALISTLLIMSASVLMQCGGSKTHGPVTRPDPTRPGWLDKGGGFFTGDRGKAFYGIGSVSGLRNISLRRTTADTQARADISRLFKVHITNLVKVYQREVTDLDAGVAEIFAQEATKGFSSMDLSGCQIIDRYYSQQEQTQYSLAVLDMTAFQNQVEKMEALSDRVQEAIIENAEKAFEELDNLENQDR